jgi:predicted metalloenzyme YecM
MPSLVVIPRVNNTRNNSFEARLSILYSARLNRRVITTSPNSRHERLLWPMEFFC